jgi:uncharacterized integral membrane protein
MTDTPTAGSRRPDPEASGSSAWVDDSDGTTTSQPTREVVEDEAAPTARDEPAAGPATTPAAQETHEDLLARTRASETWIAIIVFAIVLILLLIFILENTKKVEVSYFGASSQLPLAVAMLLSAVAGVLLTAIAGTLRILQLRRRVRKGQRLAG